MLTGMLLQAREVDKFQSGFMGGFQDDFRRVSRFERFLPPSGAQAPLVSRLESRKAEFGAGRAQVVSLTF